MFRIITKLPPYWIMALSLLLTSCLPISSSPTLSPSPTLIPSPTATLTPTVVWFPPTPTHTPFPTSTPLPPTPEQRPGLGEIIFEDDFSSAEAWALSVTAKGSVALGKNKLTIAIASPKSYLSSIRSRPAVGDFYAEITASPNLCRGADEYGLLIRVMSEQNYYRFSVSCDGQTRLDRVYHGQASSPQPWMLGSRIPIGSPSSSRLAVWAVANEMRFFINDEYQFTVRDPLLASGTFGVFARSAGGSAVTVNFSNLVVREILH
jgi:hypothetical protein